VVGGVDRGGGGGGGGGGWGGGGVGVGFFLGLVWGFGGWGVGAEFGLGNGGYGGCCVVFLFCVWGGVFVGGGGGGFCVLCGWLFWCFFFTGAHTAPNWAGWGGCGKTSCAVLLPPVRNLHILSKKSLVQERGREKWMDGRFVFVSLDVFLLIPLLGERWERAR